MIKKLYYLIYMLFFKNTPEDYRPYALFFPFIRNYLVSNYLNRCGIKLRVKSGAEISPYSYVGNYSELGSRCMIQSNVSIGSDVIMGPDVKIYSRNHNFNLLNVPIRIQGKTQLETIIGNDVWIGANVIITAGVVVGNHSVIGAGSVVTKNVPEFSVVGGIPARIIKSRKVLRKEA